MKLNKLQRYTLYCILLEEAETDSIYYGYGLCVLIENVIGKWPTNLPPLLSNEVWFSDVAPELNKYKPTDIMNVYWFKGWDERIKALKQCIEETHP